MKKGEKITDKLSDQDKIYIKTVHSNEDLGWDQRMSILMNKFGKSERTVRRWIKSLGFSDHQDIENEEIRQGKQRSYNLEKKYFIFTWAQNATPVHEPFWNKIKAYAEFLNAEIGVIQGRYQNPTSIWTVNMAKNEYWDEKFTIKEDKIIKFSYLDGSRTHLHEYLDIMADVKVIPTASDPLTGFEGLGGEKNVIFGHPRVHLKVLPALEGHNKKMMFTTGAVTIKNYTDTKAGKKGEFHHMYGFVIVEIQDDLTCHIRQVVAENNGDFIDLWYHVTDQGVNKISEAEAYIFGDIHVSQCHIPVMDKTMEMFKTIKPKNIVLHDTFNGQSISHHDKRDPVKLYQKHEKGLDEVGKEIEGVYNFFDKYGLVEDYNTIVVRSNHDDWIDRWIRNFDWREDIKNAKEYAQFLYLTLNGDAKIGVFPYLLKQRYGDKITTLDFDDSYKIKGWEVANHGHLGSNGSKGSINQFRNLNTKMLVADLHTPGRKDGVVQVGTYTVYRMGFNKGPSSWLWCGAFIHINKKVQQIFFAEDGSYTTFK